VLFCYLQDPSLRVPQTLAPSPLAQSRFLREHGFVCSYTCCDLELRDVFTSHLPQPGPSPTSFSQTVKSSLGRLPYGPPPILTLAFQWLHVTLCMRRRCHAEARLTMYAFLARQSRSSLAPSHVETRSFAPLKSQDSTILSPRPSRPALLHVERHFRKGVPACSVSMPHRLAPPCGFGWSAAGLGNCLATRAGWLPPIAAAAGQPGSLDAMDETASIVSWFWPA